MKLERNSENMACPLCESSLASFFVRKKTYDIFRCSKCNFLFVRPLPGGHQEIYSQGYFFGTQCRFGYADYEADRDSANETFGAYLEKVEKFLPEKGKLFDVGAATGLFVEYASRNGWDASGMDVSEYAVDLAKKKGLRVALGDFESAQVAANNFDLVSFWDVLEHFSYPESALRKAREVLKPGGLVAINTPDSASVPARILGRHWHLLDPPNHLNIFSRENLGRLLEQNCFEIVFFGRIRKKFSLRYIVKVLANWKPNYFFEKISRYFETSKWGNIKIPLNTRDNMLLVARKKAIKSSNTTK